jgi:hypothetical protein
MKTIADNKDQQAIIHSFSMGTKSGIQSIRFIQRGTCQLSRSKRSLLLDK